MQMEICFVEIIYLTVWLITNLFILTRSIIGWVKLNQCKSPHNLFSFVSYYWILIAYRFARIGIDLYWLITLCPFKILCVLCVFIIDRKRRFLLLLNFLFLHYYSFRKTMKTKRLNQYSIVFSCILKTFQGKYLFTYNFIFTANSNSRFI
jgi:hypothetical protein